MTCDYLHFAARGQTAGVERLMRLADVEVARREASPRPSWGAIMTKAFALAARHHCQMRQAYFSFPWPHLGTYESQIASVIVDRRVGDEDILFLGNIVHPEDQSLRALDGHLRRYKEEPVEAFRGFREALLVGRLPRPLRRLLWWLALNVLPRRRARHFGTFGVTTMSPFGARTVELPTIWTALLHYGAMAPEGEVPVAVAFDHRVMDGAVVGYTLVEMEQALHHDIMAELRTMRRARAA
jgi:hypothetical protein